MQSGHAVNPDEDDVLVDCEGTVAVEEGRVGRDEKREARSRNDGRNEKDIEGKLPGIDEKSMDTNPATGDGADVGSDLAEKQGGQLNEAVGLVKKDRQAAEEEERDQYEEDAESGQEVLISLTSLRKGKKYTVRKGHGLERLMAVEMKIADARTNALIDSVCEAEMLLSRKFADKIGVLYEAGTVRTKLSDSILNTVFCVGHVQDKGLELRNRRYAVRDKGVCC